VRSNLSNASTVVSALLASSYRYPRILDGFQVAFLQLHIYTTDRCTFAQHDATTTTQINGQ
jgi:hypothetical protein